jgi:WD40 repeat protein
MLSQGDNNSNKVDERAQVDDLVNSLLIPTNELNLDNSPLTDNLSPIENTTNNPIPVQIQTKNELTIEKRRNLTLSKCLGSIHILPAVKETYDKECQTDEAEDSYDAEDIRETPKRGSDTRIQGSGFSGSIGRVPIGSPPSSPKKEVHGSPFPIDFQSPKPISRLLSLDDQSIVYASKEFQHFIESSSKIVERSLAQRNSQIDILRDYKIEGSVRNALKNKILSSETTFEDESVKLRPVMDLQCSPHFSELFLASYGTKNTQKNTKNVAVIGINNLGVNSEREGDETPGMVAVWSLATPARPEFRFSASSPVLTARFHPQDPHLVFGGCYNGQILLWDMRMKSLPVQRSSMSGRGHRHPVYAMSITGIGATMECVTVSTDGMVCHWDPTRLNEPTNISMLSHTPQGFSKTMNTLSGDSNSLHVSSMSFSSDDANKGIFYYIF